MRNELFAILQKYDFSSKSQLEGGWNLLCLSCLRYCKSTIFQANHNEYKGGIYSPSVVCDTAKVRFFKQITTLIKQSNISISCLRYCKSTIFQANHNIILIWILLRRVVCDTAKVRFFKQITTWLGICLFDSVLFAILQKYDFSSKSQPRVLACRETNVVCDTAKVRFFKQITTGSWVYGWYYCCLRYCKSTIFQANHNKPIADEQQQQVVCDTAKVRFFKQITTWEL